MEGKAMVKRSAFVFVLLVGCGGDDSGSVPVTVDAAAPSPDVVDASGDVLLDARADIAATVDAPDEPKLDAATDAPIDSWVAPDAWTAPDASPDSWVAPPVDAGADVAADTSTPDAGIVVRCGLLPSWTPDYSVACGPPVVNDPAVNFIEWQVSPNVGPMAPYVGCGGGPCALGNACRVHFKNGTTSPGVCH